MGINDVNLLPLSLLSNYLYLPIVPTSLPALPMSTNLSLAIYLPISSFLPISTYPYFLSIFSQYNRHQCDQIGRFIGLWATFYILGAN